MFFITSVFLSFYFLSISLQYKYRKIQTAALLLMVFIFGLFIKWQSASFNNKYWYGHHLLKSRAMLLRINEPLLLKSDFFKTTAEVKGVVIKKALINCDGKIQLYIRNNKKGIDLNYGDYILINSRPLDIRNTLNPGSFDFKQYQSDQQIYHQVYLKENNYVKLNFIESNQIFSFIFSLKNHTLSILKKYIHHPSELGIAEALLIGYKNDLDNEIVDAYSKTGVVHIIAISGLHLGLIYLLLIWLLDRVPVIKNSRFIKFSILILSLWMFSLLTGSSASVLRSAVMFTCVALGKLFNRESSIYNSLSASAFVLLCFNPNLLWDVGFQLSYLAIFGIVLLQKPIQHFINTKGVFQRKLWEMISITLAAQIFTFPICLYYFHQFPVLFLISNLISVPLSTIILFMEIVLILFSNIPMIAEFIGAMTEQSIKLLNGFISFISSLPFSNIENIYSDLLSTIILYAFLISVILLCFRKNKLYLKFSLISLSMFCCCLTTAAIKINSQKKIIFYNYSKKNAIDFIVGKVFYFNEGLNDSDKSNLKRNVLIPGRKYYGASIESKDLQELYIKDKLFQFQNKLILVIDSSIKYKPSENPVTIDFLYVANNSRVEMTNVVQAIKPKIVLFASSNKNYFIKKWQQECNKLGLVYFSIKDSGAYVCNLD